MPVNVHFVYQKDVLFAIIVALIMSMRGAAPAPTLTFFSFGCFMFLCGNRVCREKRGKEEIHSIARSNVKLARQKHNFLPLFGPSFSSGKCLR